MQYTARPWIALEIPDRHNLVDHFVDRHVREGRAGRTAMICGDARVTYGEIAEQVNRVGNGLLNLGLQRSREFCSCSRCAGVCGRILWRDENWRAGCADEHGSADRRLRVFP